MQPQKKGLKALNGVGGDPGISFYSQSSFNDTTLMMDTSGIGVPFANNLAKNQAVPPPPNEKVIHVS